MAAPSQKEMEKWMETKGSKGSWTKGMKSQIEQFEGKKKKKTPNKGGKEPNTGK